MKTPAVTQPARMVLILSMLLLAVGGSLAAQSRTKDRVRRRSHRIFAAQTGPDQVTLAWDEIPGTKEYRIYLPDPNKPGPPAPGSLPWTTLSGSGRRAIVTGVQRLSTGAYLEALADGQVLYRGTFNSVARGTLARPTAPAAVQASETGETEVTLSWNPVPGATAYMIGRAVGGSGFSLICDICPPSGEFVDTTATPGLEHTYTVAAIFPLGISTRAQSNRLTVGSAQLAAATASTPTAAVWDKPMSTGTPVSVTDANDSNVGASAGTPTTGTTTTTTATTTTGTGTTAPSTGSTSNPCTPVVLPKTGIATIYMKPMASGTPVAGTDADSTSVGGSADTTGCTTDTGTSTGTGTGTQTGTGTTTQLPVGGSGPVHSATPVTGAPTTPTAPSCKLDYQRADNMWADFGRPDGFLGVESISLANGQAKVFVTDWAYEKQRNDGVNYYGSHLRVATNAGAALVRLRVRNPMSAVGALLRPGIQGYVTGWVTITAGGSVKFRDDLMEVHCGQ